jgi:hypothetical protein
MNMLIPAALPPPSLIEERLWQAHQQRLIAFSYWVTMLDPIPCPGGAPYMSSAYALQIPGRLW